MSSTLEWSKTLTTPGNSSLSSLGTILDQLWPTTQSMTSDVWEEPADVISEELTADEDLTSQSDDLSSLCYGSESDDNDY